MKVRDLKRKSGEAVVSAWPPQWGSWYKAGDKFAIGEVGVLKSVKSIGSRLSLTIEYDGREHSGGLQWDEPPSLVSVEKVLKAHVGQLVNTIGNLDV